VKLAPGFRPNLCESGATLTVKTYINNMAEYNQLLSFSVSVMTTVSLSDVRFNGLSSLLQIALRDVACEQYE
jgi:hypothetical protein